ncbi:MAG: LysM domain-containing protein [Simkaniaceae bacterium]
MGEDSYWVKKIRKLTQILIVSGSLNVAFLATLIYFALPKKEIFIKSTSYRTPPLTTSHLKVLQNYFETSYESLLQELENEEQIFDGFSYRDLALSCLVSFHDFDIERALPGFPLQKREMAYLNKSGGEQVELTLFPGLKKEHFVAISDFASKERWPLTTKGLFFELQSLKQPPSSLVSSFLLTKEFHAIEILFNHLPAPVSKEILLSLLLQGSWDRLASFVKRHQDLDALSPLERREFLLDYAGGGSTYAATLLVATDRDFVQHELDDERLVSVMSNLQILTEETESLVKELLYSLRSDKVRTLAGVKLYALLGERPPEPYDHFTTLKRFLPEFFDEITPQMVNDQPSHSSKRYRIKEGDTLWHISRDYKVSVDEILKANNLKSAYLLPVGKELIIPNS